MVGDLEECGPVCTGYVRVGRDIFAYLRPARLIVPPLNLLPHGGMSAETPGEAGKGRVTEKWYTVVLLEIQTRDETVYTAQWSK